jgi:hypothetical protein
MDTEERRARTSRLDWDERGDTAIRAGTAENSRELTHCRGFKQHRQGDFDFECFFDLSEKLDRQGRIAAQVKVVFVESD